MGSQKSKAKGVKSKIDSQTYGISSRSSDSNSTGSELALMDSIAVQ